MAYERNAGAGSVKNKKKSVDIISKAFQDGAKALGGALADPIGTGRRVAEGAVREGKKVASQAKDNYNRVTKKATNLMQQGAKALGSALADPVGTAKKAGQATKKAAETAKKNYERSTAQLTEVTPDRTNTIKATDVKKQTTKKNKAKKNKAASVSDEPINVSTKGKKFSSTEEMKKRRAAAEAQGKGKFNSTEEMKKRRAAAEAKGKGKFNAQEEMRKRREKAQKQKQSSKARVQQVFNGKGK